ncbi:MAG: tetratricopeptide repeat protein, partial [Candidatus Bathyarchaeia archaeon]
MPNTIREIKKTIDKALEVAERIEYDYGRSIALSDIAKALAEIGDIDKAKKTIDKALEVAERIWFDLHRSLALSDIAKALAEIGDIDKAL